MKQKTVYLKLLKNFNYHQKSNSSNLNIPIEVEDHKDNDREEIFSERVRAGKRTYFFDVKATRSNDYYLTITESKRRYKDDGYFYEKHKIFLYKEDFNKFVQALNDTVSHVKEELMPEVDFEQFDREKEEMQKAAETVTSTDDSELKWD